MNFLMNIRYVKSRSDQQLRKPGSERDTDACSPEETSNGAPIVPCGLIAWSLFNDTYGFVRNNQQLTINKRGISWKSDRDRKFGDNVFPKNFQNGTLRGGADLDQSKPVRFYPYIVICNFPCDLLKASFSCIKYTRDEF